MLRLRLLPPALLALPLIGGCSEAGPAPETSGPRRPNVLLVVIDTLRSDHLSC